MAQDGVIYNMNTATNDLLETSRLDMLQIEVEVQLDDMPNVWIKTDITLAQQVEMYNTGLLHNRPVVKIKLYETNHESGEDELKATHIYDVVAAKQGRNPWLITLD